RSTTKNVSGSTRVFAAWKKYWGDVDYSRQQLSCPHQSASPILTKRIQLVQKLYLNASAVTCTWIDLEFGSKSSRMRQRSFDLFFHIGEGTQEAAPGFLAMIRPPKAPARRKRNACWWLCEAHNSKIRSPWSQLWRTSSDM